MSRSEEGMMLRRRVSVAIGRQVGQLPVQVTTTRKRSLRYGRDALGCGPPYETAMLDLGLLTVVPQSSLIAA